MSDRRRARPGNKKGPHRGPVSGVPAARSALSRDSLGAARRRTGQDDSKKPACAYRRCQKPRQVHRVSPCIDGKVSPHGPCFQALFAECPCPRGPPPPDARLSGMHGSSRSQAVTAAFQPETADKPTGRPGRCHGPCLSSQMRSHRNRRSAAQLRPEPDRRRAPSDPDRRAAAGRAA